MAELASPRHMGFRIEFIDLASSHPSITYRLRSLDEIVHGLLTITIHPEYKPQWTIGEIVEIALPMVSQREGITMRRLREERHG